MASITGNDRRRQLGPRWFAGREYWSGVILVGLAFVGLMTSFSITRVPPAKPDAKFRLNPLGDLFAQIREIRKDRIPSLAVIGKICISGFWQHSLLLDQRRTLRH